ncbi:MAG: YciI family protein [Myxococcota bacterium]
MKYFVLLAAEGGDRGPWNELSPAEQEADMAKHGAFAEACAQRDGVELVGGEALGDGTVATTLRTKNGEMAVTDGPFAEAAEQIGGYYVVEAPDLDTVIELCRILPPYDLDLRPVLDLG